WIARMLDAGEDPRYIMRRLAILASEDIGNADPRAASLAESCWSLVERIGMPEARITIAQCATYLALAPKSNASYVAIDEALTDIKRGRTQPVPVYLRDPNSSPIQDDEGASRSMRERDGERYRYSHAESDGVTDQSYLGVERSYYRPTDRGAEKILGERLERIRAMRIAKRQKEADAR
ncbi:MAG: replication-associated recombination protein A, partial [Planctomycetota bacterium]